MARFRRELPKRGAEFRWDMKNRDFESRVMLAPVWRFISEMIEDRDIVRPTMKRQLIETHNRYELI